jgi:uncharacterized protein (TIGR03067 family)
MMAAMLLGLLVGGAARADDDPEPNSGDDRKLVGEWELTELKFMGMAFPLPNEGKVSLVFKKDGTLSSDGGGLGNQKDGKWKVIKGKKSPKQLDMTGDGMTTQMIYKLDKDVLTIAGAEGNGKERPKDFASAQMTMVLKRKAKK